MKGEEITFTQLDIIDAKNNHTDCLDRGGIKFTSYRTPGAARGTKMTKPTEQDKFNDNGIKGYPQRRFICDLTTRIFNGYRWAAQSIVQSELNPDTFYCHGVHIHLQQMLQLCEV